MTTIKHNILKKIEAAGLVGRGGACFPTAVKWAAVKEALAAKKQGYIIVNGAEGEPGLKKDAYIFQHHGAAVIEGVSLADKFLGSGKIKKIYIFLNHEYFRNYAANLKTILATKKYKALREKTEFFIKPEKLTYISGEETALLNLIEGKKTEPRLKPPYPTEHGLHSRPTLINNPETFYDVSLVAANRYEAERFYTISGVAKRRGVYALPANLTIEEVLHKTNNYPTEPFFVQVGGEASGEVLNSDQLTRPVDGSGLIMIYDQKHTDSHKLIKYWLNFYHDQSCGQCTPCREGTYRLWEMANKKNFVGGDGAKGKGEMNKLFWEIVAALEETSFCALGSSLPVPLKSYYQNILKK
jgi:NADH:ubiquinone oxidoreductase subunit F (NADH-binding)